MTHVRGWRAALTVGVCAVLTVACSTPGWQLDDARGSTWYVEPQAGSGSEASAERDYQPVFHEITPSLIRKQAAVRSATGGRRKANLRLPRPSASHGQYRVGKGDLLSVIVFGHPDLTNPAGTTESVESSGRLVDAGGEIFMPFIGNMEVAGKTVDEIRSQIAEGLKQVINNPQVDVRLLQYRSQTVLITGDIPRPCRVPIRDIQLTVLEALNECDSLVAQRGNDPQQTDVHAVQLVRGDQVYPINLSELYREGGGPVPLQDGDRLIVDDSMSRVFVVGEFSEQRAVAYSSGGMNLADAMAAGGGLNLDTADAGGLYVIRGFVGEDSGPENGVETRLRPQVYHLDASSVDAMILADRFELRPRDVVFAAPASLVNFNRALGQITPSLDILLRSALIFTR